MSLDRYGYGLCVRCRCRRPEAALAHWPLPPAPWQGHWQCLDDAFCSRAAGVGRGELDGGTPRGPELNAEVAP